MVTAAHARSPECYFNLTLPLCRMLFLRLSFMLGGTRVEFEFDGSCFRWDEFGCIAQEIPSQGEAVDPQ